MKILVCGASGLIGSTTLRILSERRDWQVYGTLRSDRDRPFFKGIEPGRLLAGMELTDPDILIDLFKAVRPDVVVNCAGLTKHLPGADDPLRVIPINTLLPHRLASLCTLTGARLIHVSTDCIFSGTRGGYTEADLPDATDIYGRSKAMGEVAAVDAVTLRTSTIGHELRTAYGLLDWFLAQEGRCKGYRRAIFSGVPTVVFAKIIRDQVIPRPELQGIYQVAAAPIAKYDLLQMIASTYGKAIEIVPDDELVIDRSLDPGRFTQATGYRVPQWPELIEAMHSDQMKTRT